MFGPMPTSSAGTCHPTAGPSQRRVTTGRLRAATSRIQRATFITENPVA
jgi:hypothetical protein